MRLWLLLIALSPMAVFAEDANIQGKWKLDYWEVISKKDNSRAEFCRGATGYLVYDLGLVSTAIICPKKEKGAKAEPADSYERMFFYGGTFTVKEDEITKQIYSASFKPLLGKEVLRKVEKVTDHELILSGSLGPESSLYIRWTK